MLAGIFYIYTQID